MSELTAQTLLAGRYRVEAFVGRGGMAEVYKVWDTRRTTYLAMKLLREDMALDKVFLRRFKREAQTLARLQHPSIVRFYGLEQDGQLAFILMDFVEGRSLKHDIFDLGGPMLSQRVLEIMRPVCSALHYAHSEGFVHCDVKPGNILIDNLGRILVSDFGVSRMTDAATATMVGAGTPAYMAPEQIRGEELSPQTDIYGLGVVLYEMLTGGERPFTGDHARTGGSTSEKVRWEHLNLEPVSPRKYNKKLSGELEAVVMRCLAKEPTDRFATALDLFNALQSTAQPSAIAESPTLVATEREALAQTVPALEPDLADVSSASAAAVPQRGLPVWVVALVGVLVVAGVVGVLALGATSGSRHSAAAMAPTATDLPAVPTDRPTVVPTDRPTVVPTDRPTVVPTDRPTVVPTDRPTAVPTDQPIPTVAATFTVDARQTWQDTGITVNTSDTVMIEYVSGKWTTWVGGHPYVEADGNEQIGDPRNAGHPVPSAFPGVLIAKVRNSAPQEIGMSRTLQFETSGTLYLQMNDDYLEDNDGQLIVQITVSGTTARSGPADTSLQSIPEWIGEEGLIAHLPFADRWV